MIILDIVIVIALLIIIILLTFKYASREALIKSNIDQIKMLTDELTRQTSSSDLLLSAQIKNSAAVVYSYRSEFFRCFQHVVPENGNVPLNDASYSSFRDICRFTTDNVRDALLAYFRSKDIVIGEDVSVAVKLIISSEKFSLPYRKHVLGHLLLKRSYE